MEATEVLKVQEHPGHTKLKLALDLKLELADQSAAVPISLFDSYRKLVVGRAYLHPEQNENDSSEDFLSGVEVKRYQVEVPDSALKKIINHADGVLSAYPYNPNFKVEVPTSTRRTPYEIQF